MFWRVHTTAVILLWLVGRVGAAGWDYVASPEAGWPQWRGPRRDGICQETNLLQRWPEGGPSVLWETKGLGRGYSAPVITGGRLFITGDVGEQLVIFAMDLESRSLWQATNGASWKDPYPGARACVVVRDGRLFHMNAHGRVTCLDAATGNERWSVQLFERFGGKSPTWGMSECLLVDGDRVIVTPGGTRALLAALDVGTGRTLWESEPLRYGAGEAPSHERLAEPAGGVDGAGYTSPILVQQGERRMLLGCSNRHAFGADPQSGKLLWTRPLKTRFDVIAASPTLVRGDVFVTAPDAGGGRLYRLAWHGQAVVPELVWNTRLDTCHGGVLAVGDALFGSWYRASKGWARVDATTGAVQYERNEVPKGAMLYADQRLYCLAEDGEMHLWEAGPLQFEERGRFRLVKGKAEDAWAHPVIWSGRLYLRFHERLAAYDVRRAPSSGGREARVEERASP